MTAQDQPEDDRRGDPDSLERDDTTLTRQSVNR